MPDRLTYYELDNKPKEMLYYLCTLEKKYNGDVDTILDNFEHKYMSNSDDNFRNNEYIKILESKGYIYIDAMGSDNTIYIWTILGPQY
ncbi:hypothetical protein [Pectinatus haikarae]|uniref:Phage protein n=1 Tax=Pectinatus haikarae TaxID=349096 RepID=A0ABT9YB77_9FIRM|nr:hypothetical protein [Pectinatus haikarae]MDQ0204969.1 hypothetical protein [Pectinatus haikarae]